MSLPYPPTTDASRILDAIDRLRDLRSQATNHYDTLNNWLIIDTLTDVITLLQATDPTDLREPDESDDIPVDYSAEVFAGKTIDGWLP